jgi:hypothetical protein
MCWLGGLIVLPSLSLLTISIVGVSVLPMRNPSRRAPRIATSTWALHVGWLSFVSFSETGCAVMGSMLRPPLLLEEGDAMAELGVTLDSSDTMLNSEERNELVIKAVPFASDGLHVI